MVKVEQVIEFARSHGYDGDVRLWKRGSFYNLYLIEPIADEGDSGYPMAIIANHDGSMRIACAFDFNLPPWRVK